MCLVRNFNPWVPIHKLSTFYGCQAMVLYRERNLLMPLHKTTKFNGCFTPVVTRPLDTYFHLLSESLQSFFWNMIKGFTLPAIILWWKGLEKGSINYLSLFNQNSTMCIFLAVYIHPPSWFSRGKECYFTAWTENNEADQSTQLRVFKHASWATNAHC